MARMSDPWLAAFEEAKSTADEVFHLLTERDEAMTQGSQEGVVMRLTAAARRKWSALGSRIEQLEKALTYGGQSERETDRRRDMLARLKNQSQQLQERLSRNAARQRLLGGASGSGRAPGEEASTSRPQETDETAALDERGLLDLQNEIIRDQDTALDDLSRAVSSTKQIAVAIDEELDLQHRLLDDLDDAMDHTRGRLHIAHNRLKVLMRKSNDCKLTCLLIIVIIVLVIVLLVVAKVSSWF